LVVITMAKSATAATRTLRPKRFVERNIAIASKNWTVVKRAETTGRTEENVRANAIWVADKQLERVALTVGRRFVISLQSQEGNAATHIGNLL